MTFRSHCPRCDAQLTAKHTVTGSAICECGWIDSTPMHVAEMRNEKKTITAMVIATAIMAGSYAHLMNWGAFAVAIPVVKIQQMTGTLSNQGYFELADACVGLNKWSCATDAYTELFAQSRDPKALAELASMQARLGDQATALQTYAQYEAAGGNDGIALLRYGKLLENGNRADEALRLYEASIVAMPEALPVQATSGIVRIMMKQARYQEAYARVIAFHESAGNAKGYLNTELAQLEQYLGTKKSGKDSKHSASAEAVAPKVARK